MFNISESDRIVMAQHPSDMRMGVNCLSGQVRSVGLDPTDGNVYIFVGRSRKVMKILHWEFGGYTMYYKRLERGRFHPRIFLRQGVGFRSMKWSELVLLMEGISPKAARRKRFEPGSSSDKKGGDIASETVVIFGYLANYPHLSGVNKTLTYDELVARVAALEAEVLYKDEDIKRKDEDIKRKSERIAYLERLLFGAKRDKLAYNGPGLFDELFDEAANERDKAIEQTAKEIHAEAENRRAKAKGNPQRPAKYHYYGLEERTTVVVPEGIDLEQYDIIGKDISRVLHRAPAQVWVEVIERPILRHKADKVMPQPRIVQAPASQPVIGGNHIGADMLSQIIIDKYVYHLPEYRQIQQ